ncbi:MAG: glycosyltransferase family 4 protein [Planctomycetota bacterium]|nr:glycosyltransferase family 4 protein [Planctomycetota bacterium]
MRIALDCSSAARAEATGVAMYIRRLVAAFGRVGAGHEFLLAHRLSRVKQCRHFVAPPDSKFRAKILLEPAQVFHPFFSRSLDVFHGLDARLPGPGVKARLVVTVHDVYSALQSREFAAEEFRRMKAERYRDLVERADRIVVVSEACRRDVLETLEPDPAKLRVVHEAGGEEFTPRSENEIKAIRAKYGLDAPYLVYVGTINKRKNLPRMIRAFARAREAARSDALFAVGGRVGFGGEEIHRAIEESRAGGFVRLLGYLPDADVPALYGGALGLFFCTLYEGFGIPVLEAFSCGCPVLGGTKGSVPEIAGPAALLADPENLDEMAAQAARLLSGEDLRRRLRAEGLERAKAFSWDRAARECLEIYQES